MNDLVNVDQLTTEIILYKQQTAQNFIEIGRRLIKVKELLPHGEWGNYLKDKVNFSQNVANKLMRCANEFSNCSPAHNLPISKMFELLSLPPAEREEFIQNNDVENMTKKKLREEIKKRKKLEEANEYLVSARNEYKQAAEDIQNELNKTRKNFSTVMEDRRKLQQENQDLIDENETLNEALQQGATMSKEQREYIQKLKAEIEELKNKPAPTPETVETIVVQDDPKTLARIKELEEKLKSTKLIAQYDGILTNDKANIIRSVNAYCDKLDFLVKNDKKIAKTHLNAMQKIIKDWEKVLNEIEEDLI